jgi:hypothetical protein
MAAVAAGVSVISGVAGLVSKNKQAAAERAQLQAQQYQQAVSAASQAAQLQAQQTLNRQQYEMGVLSRLAAYQQGLVGIAAQDATAQLQAQQQQTAIESGAYQGLTQASQAVDQLNRQGTAIQIGTDQRIGAALQKEGDINTQLANASVDQAMKMTEGQRRAVSVQAAGKLRSTSSDVAQQGDMMEQLSNAFADGLNLDRTQTLAALQSMGEEQLALIAEQLGLQDTSQSFDNLATNLKLQALGTENASSNNRSNLDLTRSALQSAQQNLDFGYSTTDKASRDAYRSTDYGLGLQRGLVADTNTSVQNNYASAINNVKGAGFFDYLNFGLNTYGAVSPLLRQTPSIQVPTSTSPTSTYSGFPTAYSNYG